MKRVRPRYAKFLTLTIIILSTLMSVKSNAQECRAQILKYPQKVINYTQQSISKTEDVIEKYLDQKDTIYVTPNKYRLTLMAQYMNYYEYYRFSAPASNQSITLSPDNSDKLGVYIGWKWLFLGWAFDINKSNAKTDWNFSFYTSKVGIDIFYRKRSEGFKIRGISGIKDSDGKEINTYSRRFNGISVDQRGVNIYYIFNNKNFSYPAAYSQTTNQRLSCGSFILGINYSEQSFNINPEKFDLDIQAGMSPTLKFNKIKYKDYSINFGYSYNWVFAKNCLANISATPAIGYKNTSFKFEDGEDFIKNINFDFIFRTAVVYNNSRYFVGASLISHTYSYRKSNLSIVNGFGTINIYAGINLFKK